MPNPQTLTLKNRCTWANSSELEKVYHDSEWGVPVHDDKILFEFLILEGVQAGLNWLTILKKRENYRLAFDDFNPKTIANYDQAKIDKLLLNPGIIRNKLKVNSAVINAKIFLKIQAEYGSFDKYIWSFVDFKPIQNQRKSMGEVPASTEISDKMSKELKKLGFKFVGTTICYAFMQAVGMVNDRTMDCFKYEEIKGLS